MKNSIPVRKPVAIAESLFEQAEAGLRSLVEECPFTGNPGFIEQSSEGLLEFAAELRRFAELYEAVAVLRTVQAMPSVCPNCRIDLMAFARSGVIVNASDQRGVETKL